MAATDFCENSWQQLEDYVREVLLIQREFITIFFLSVNRRAQHKNSRQWHDVWAWKVRDRVGDRGCRQVRWSALENCNENSQDFFKEGKHDLHTQLTNIISMILHDCSTHRCCGSVSWSAQAAITASNCTIRKATTFGSWWTILMPWFYLKLSISRLTRVS